MLGEGENIEKHCIPSVVSILSQINKPSGHGTTVYINVLSLDHDELQSLDMK